MREVDHARKVLDGTAQSRFPESPRAPAMVVLLLEVRMETRRQGQTISERSGVGAAARGKRRRLLVVGVAGEVGGINQLRLLSAFIFWFCFWRQL